MTHFNKAYIKTSDNAEVSSCIFLNSTFNTVSFMKTDFRDCDFSRSVFNNTTILTSDFIHCNFTEADLIGIEVDGSSQFPASNFEDAKINRYALDCISNAQIPKSSKVKMIIEDDIAKLRLLYGGYKRLLNTIALIFFLSPYLFFTGRLWVQAHFFPTEPGQSMTMFGAILRYIWSGGTSWQSKWDFVLLPFAFFVIALIFNILRLFLLKKTMDLEFNQEVRGLPVKFSLKEKIVWKLFKRKFPSRFDWGQILRVTNIFFWVYIVIVILHTGYFLLQEIKI